MVHGLLVALRSTVNGHPSRSKGAAGLPFLCCVGCILLKTTLLSNHNLLIRLKAANACSDWSLQIHFFGPKRNRKACLVVVKSCQKSLHVKNCFRGNLLQTPTDSSGDRAPTRAHIYIYMYVCIHDSHDSRQLWCFSKRVDSSCRAIIHCYLILETQIIPL